MPWQPRPSLPLAAGPCSPVHAVADPGITDSRAMPRVPPPAPLPGFSETHLHAASRGSRVHRPGPEDGRLPPKLGALGISPTSVLKDKCFIVLRTLTYDALDWH
nr:uncharacterized protein LOC129048692 [Pongo abelii]